MLVDDVEQLNYDSLEAVAHLRASERYTEIMQVDVLLLRQYALLSVASCTVV